MLRGKNVLSIFIFVFMFLQMYGICAEARTVTVAKDGVLENVMEAEAPEGSIINGIVMDTELFVEFMKDFWNKNKVCSFWSVSK